MNKSISNVSLEKHQALKIKKTSNYIFIILALLVCAITVAALILPAITSENITFCGYSEEHAHAEGCYAKKLICTIADESDTNGNESSHTHSQECYEFSLSCDLKEHIHTLECTSDPTADIESIEEIRASMSSISLSDDPARNILSVALSQIGYSESTANFKVSEDGEDVSGYTRFGEWFGDPYADWNALFVSFCADIAGVDAIPKDSNLQSWIAYQSMNEDGLFCNTSYIPGSGDIVFFDIDADGIADRTAIVNSILLSDDTLCVIEGDSNGSVKANEYALTSGSIVGYIQLSSRIQENNASSDALNNAEGSVVGHPDGHAVYQYSSHRIDGIPLLCYALILNKGDTQGSLSPAPIDWNAKADANYTVAYTLNGISFTDSQGVNYDTHDISLSAYSDNSEKLSAITSHSYPFITAEQMKLELKKAYKNGETSIDLSCCSENEFIAAAQWAIWNAAGGTDADYAIEGCEFPKDSSSAINPLTGTGHTDNDTVNSHVKAIKDWLMSRTLPDRLSVADKSINIVRNADGSYTATVTLTLNRAIELGEELLISKNVCGVSSIDAVYGEGTSSLTVSFERLSVDELLNTDIYMQVIADKMVVFVHDSDEADMISGKMREITYDAAITLDVATTSVDAAATWTDLPPSEATIDVTLYADGRPYGSTITLDKSNGWSYRWDGLIKYSESGVPIVYTVEAGTVPGYLTDSVRSEADGVSADISYIFKNTLSEKTVSYKVRAEWSGRADGKYPKSLTVQLLQNGIEYGSPVTLSSENNWAYLWEALPEGANGNIFEYSLKETELNGYTSELMITEENSIQLMTLSNSWDPEHLPVTLEVVDISNPTILLPGAVFDLFSVCDGDEADLIPGTTDITGIKERTVITDDNGRFLIDDLLIGNTYCLVETASTLGYARLSEPIVISIEEDDNGQGVAKVLKGGSSAYVLEDDGNCTLSVKNRESYILPETGGAGILIYYVSGLSLITIAIFFITIKKLNIFRRKRK